LHGMNTLEQVIATPKKTGRKAWGDVTKQVGGRIEQGQKNGAEPVSIADPWKTWG